MNGKRRKRHTALIATLALAVMAGCTNSGENAQPSSTPAASGASASASQPNQQTEKEPVTLKLTSDNALFMSTLAPGRRATR